MQFKWKYQEKIPEYLSCYVIRIAITDRRILLHVLPKGFFKVRCYGIFSSCYRKQNIETPKQLLLFLLFINNSGGNTKLI